MFKKPNIKLCNLLNKLNIKHDENACMSLIINENSLELCDRKNPKHGIIKVNFTSKKNNYRCNNIIIKNEVLYKAIGIKKSYYPHVLDATAGLGTDAFILSFLGCHVTMIERNPIIAALLYDGLNRGYKDQNIGFWLKQRLHLIFNDSNKMLDFSIIPPDVIYLDPMFPIRKKKTLPKKNMQFFRKLVGYDENTQDLLNISRKLAKKRVVVKRPHYAKPISVDKVDFFICSKNHRFDIYKPFKKTGVHII